MTRLINISEGKAVIDDMINCIFCGHCGAVCPVNAIGFVEDEYSDDIMEFNNFKIEELIQKVDTKLYYAKNNGKNQFVCNKDII
jgi:formate hydrogenlyase subunit 6/NADH:ubiquinone oxidoreductase subunit I